MQKNTHSLKGLQRTISSDSTTSPPSLFQRQKLRQAIVSQLDDEQMKDLDSLVDLIQSLRKRELSLCLFNPIYLRQKIIEAYRALYFSEKPTSTNTTPSLVHLEQSVYEEDAMDVLASLEGMSLNKKKRAFGDIFFPYVKVRKMCFCLIRNSTLFRQQVFDVRPKSPSNCWIRFL
jgi:hypothetical protein